MCGIFGIASQDRYDFDLEGYTDTIAHRGPDECGYYKDNHIGMGHRRLSIIDLSGGQQPIFNEDRSQCIIFNGEIYNYKAIKSELLHYGHQFTTNSDTETILHAYEQWGEKCVDRLRGMFAFAIWDSVKKKLFLARDRLGIKPLFYALYNGRLYFASEMKAILADPSIPRKIDDEALVSYFSLSYIPAPLTIFQHIRKLPAGYTLSWQQGKIRLNQYWDVQFAPEYGKSESYFIEEFMHLFEEAVRMRLMSEVPLGAFLSGGVDSSAVVALMSKSSSEPVNTFCIGFGGDVGGYLDERGYARSVADRYQANHSEFNVVPEPQGIIDIIVRAFDEPFADDSAIPSYFVCKMARQLVTVALSGLGGDEAFGGYERYLGLKLRNTYNLLPLLLRQQLLPLLVNMLPERADGHYTINHLKRFVRAGALPEDIAYYRFLTIIEEEKCKALLNNNGRMASGFSANLERMVSLFNSKEAGGNRGDLLNRAFYCDLKTYLPEDILCVTDRMSMHHSLEVRVPFIDHKIIELCAKIPSNLKIKASQKKYLLKKAVRPLLPDQVIDHRKQGFVGPMTQWLKKDLKKFTLDMLSKENIETVGVLNHAVVQDIVKSHFEGKEIHDTLIWAMLVFQRWHQIYIQN
ncbi:asparagine synthetase B [Desulfosarcina alkanivorans]|uniref:asparagine synthase (glutamine-hydrolyzing) n=1 Tax=Desulfosarcina alkanivorans TaxID=571177 RepID=A0A5K7YFA1_9BACT|nr:asparagine synthase (glutamine-hydrolyzing) [Desulfosarcina alkanivorans]BBO67253.1 asparagine synthetase B [Desulfosarcina alkanivorans]